MTPTFTEELAELLSAGATPDELVSFRFSDAAAARLEVLIREEKNGRATPDERDEVRSALALGHLLTRTKLNIARKKRSLAVPPAAAPARLPETAAA